MFFISDLMVISVIFSVFYQPFFSVFYQSFFIEFFIEFFIIFYRVFYGDICQKSGQKMDGQQKKIDKKLEIGEIFVQGKNVIKNYWKNQEVVPLNMAN